MPTHYKEIPRRRCRHDKPTSEVCQLSASVKPASWRHTDALDTSTVTSAACHPHHCQPPQQSLTDLVSSPPAHPNNIRTPTVTAGPDQHHADISYKNARHSGLSSSSVINQSIDRSIGRSVSRSIDQSLIHQSINSSNKQTNKQINKQSINQSIDQSIDQ